MFPLSQICVNDELVAKKFAYYIRESAESSELDEVDRLPIMLSSSILTQTVSITSNKLTAETPPSPGTQKHVTVCSGSWAIIYPGHQGAFVCTTLGVCVCGHIHVWCEPVQYLWSYTFCCTKTVADIGRWWPLCCLWLCGKWELQWFIFWKTVMNLSFEFILGVGNGSWQILFHSTVFFWSITDIAAAICSDSCRLSAILVLFFLLPILCELSLNSNEKSNKCVNLFQSGINTTPLSGFTQGLVAGRAGDWLTAPSPPQVSSSANFVTVSTEINIHRSWPLTSLLFQSQQPDLSTSEGDCRPNVTDERLSPGSQSKRSSYSSAAERWAHVWFSWAIIVQ